MTKVRLGSTQKKIMEVLERFEYGLGFQYSTIAYQTHLSLSQVRHACGRLDRRGLIFLEFHGGNQGKRVVYLEREVRDEHKNSGG